MAYEYPAQNGKLDGFTLRMMRDVLKDHATVTNHDTGFCCQVADSYKRKVAIHDEIVAKEIAAKATGKPVFEAASVPQTRYIKSLSRQCPLHLLSPAHRVLVETVQAQNEISREDAKEVLSAMILVVDGPTANADKKSISSTRMITPKQLGYLKKLLATRKHSFQIDLTNLADIPFSEASDMITELSQAPIAGTATLPNRADEVLPEEGLYKVGNDVYKVQAARANGGGHLYAKQMNLETGEFHYVGRKPFKLLTADTKMTAEEAGKYGKLYGKCIRCGRELTDEFSIANGLGKICIGKF